MRKPQLQLGFLYVRKRQKKYFLVANDYTAAELLLDESSYVFVAAHAQAKNHFGSGVGCLVSAGQRGDPASHAAPI